MRDIRRVAIVDDDLSDAEIASFEVRDAGFEPLILWDDNVEILLRNINKHADAAICDHRLKPHRKGAQFTGAELVAKLFARNTPAVLVTQFVDTDAAVSIRQWRRKIPVLLQRDAAGPNELRAGLDRCLRELRGEPAPDRIPHRAIVRVEDVRTAAGDEVIDVIVAQWNPKHAVRLPLSLVPSHLRPHVVPDARLIAMVNIEASHAADLYFDEFELAPLPNENDGLS